MRPEIRGSDVWIKADLAAFLMALQQTAAHLPLGEFHDGYLAALASFRAMLNIPVTLADIDALSEPTNETVRVLRTERRRLR